MAFISKDMAKVLLLGPAAGAMMLLSACGGTAATPTAVATNTVAAVPTNTVMIAAPTNTAMLAAPTDTTTSATMGGTSTAGSSMTGTGTPGAAMSGTSISGTPAALTYSTYTAVTGTWSIDYPSTWVADEKSNGVSFGPSDVPTTRVRATYGEMTTQIDPATLPQQIGQGLTQTYPSYKEVSHDTIGSASHVAFTINVGGVDLSGQAFAEQRGKGFYLFTFVNQKGDASIKEPFTHMLASIKLPNVSGSGTSTLGDSTPIATTGTPGTTMMGTPGADTSTPGATMMGTPGATMMATPGAMMATPGVGDAQPTVATTPSPASSR
ncbi:MAG: hypothetical protein M3014_01565 [Chloroflexota bacterium]|nr:hypothetical protein [Chloroflexota bacterium]